MSILTKVFPPLFPMETHLLTDSNTGRLLEIHLAHRKITGY